MGMPHARPNSMSNCRMPCAVPHTCRRVQLYTERGYLGGYAHNCVLLVCATFCAPTNS